MRGGEKKKIQNKNNNKNNKNNKIIIIIIIIIKPINQLIHSIGIINTLRQKLRKGFFRFQNMCRRTRSFFRKSHGCSFFLLLLLLFVVGGGGGDGGWSLFGSHKQ